MEYLQKKVLVSVIIPVYNIESFLHNCIKSILNQSYSYLELILVDDGSTDSSGKICDEYGSKDERVCVIHQKNGGVSLARYNGVQIATGEWCFFVDGDDIVPKNALEILLKDSESHDIINGIFCGCDVEGNIISTPKYSQYEIGVYSNVEFIRNIILDRRNGSLCRQIIRLSVLKDSIVLLPRTIRIAEDWLLSIKIGLNIKSCLGIPEVVYQYNDNPNSVTHTVQRSLKDVELVDQYLEQFIGNNILFAEELFRCRLRHFGMCISEKEIMTSSFVSYVRNNAKKYNLDITERFLVCLLYIHNTYLRVSLWKLYNIPKRLKNKIIYLYSKKLKK